MLGVLLNEQLHRLLWDGDQPDGVLCLRPRYDEIVVCVLRGLFADGDGLLSDIQVFPPQGHQFAFSDSADQLRIENSQGIPPLCCIQVGF